MENDIRAQDILMESVKYPLIPHIEGLETSKEIYDKMVELLSEDVINNVISLRYDLHKLKLSNDKWLSS